jgi:hypothetical protein
LFDIRYSFGSSDQSARLGADVGISSGQEEIAEQKSEQETRHAELEAGMDMDG